MSDITRQKTIDYLYYLKTHYPKNLIIPEYIDFAISSLETDEAYQLEYESTTKDDLTLIHTEGLDEEIRCTMCTNSMKSDRGCDGSCVVNNDMYKAVMDTIEKRIQPTTKNDLGVDTILRADARSLICNTDIKHHMSGMSREVFKDLYNGMDELPSVTPQEPKTGHWTEEFNDLEGEVRFTCSSCGKYQLFGTDFCYHCGSDNREVVEE